MGKYDLEPVDAEPVVAVVKAKRSIPWIDIIQSTAIALAIILLILPRLGVGPLPPGPGPEPTPPAVVITEDVETITRDAEMRFIKNKAEAARRIAADIKAGKITNSNQYGKMALEYQDAIERDAFAGVIELNQKYIRESAKEGWTKEQLQAIAELQERKARGYERMQK